MDVDDCELVAEPGFSPAIDNYVIAKNNTTDKNTTSTLKTSNVIEVDYYSNHSVSGKNYDDDGEYLY